MNRKACLTILVFAFFVSFIVVTVAHAQIATPAPPVPEFTLKLTDHSYDISSSTTTTIDPYTGKQTVTTNPGYHVQNMSIEVTIKNQQFTPYSIDNQQMICLFYNVSFKGHYAGVWSYYPSGIYGRDSDSVVSIVQSASDYTVIPFAAPTEGQMDFRVQAQIGYYNVSQLFVPVPGAPFYVYKFIGEVSGWSSTQTITIPETSTTTSPSTNPTLTSNPTLSPSPNPSSSVPEFPTWTAVPLVFAAALATFAILGKRKNQLKR